MSRIDDIIAVQNMIASIEAGSTQEMHEVLQTDYYRNVCIDNSTTYQPTIIKYGQSWNSSQFVISFRQVDENLVEHKCIRTDDGLVLYQMIILTTQTARDYSILKTKRFLIKNNGKIEKLTITGETLPYDWRFVRDFPLLTELSVNTPHLARTIISRTLRPLCNLIVQNSLDITQPNNNILSFEPQIYRVYGNVLLPKTIVNDNQLCRFRSSCILIAGERITEQGVIRFIYQWLNGERNNFYKLEIRWNRAHNFDVTIIEDMLHIYRLPSSRAFLFFCSAVCRSAKIEFSTYDNHTYLTIQCQ